MSLILATLCLNEMEWLPRLYHQHKNWPTLTKWIFVEAADAIFAETNPDLVSTRGLSVDGTTSFLQNLSRRDARVIHIPFGISRHEQADQCKCPARNAYAEVADTVNPDFLFVLDADEFYRKRDQHRITNIMKKHGKHYTSFCFPQVHPWRPESIKDQPLLQYEAIGGFWNVSHIRGWTWYKGLRYRTTHNHLETPDGINLHEKLCDYRGINNAPTAVHCAFASNAKNRIAKHRYYEARGEGKEDGREWYVESRAAFENWKIGDKLPYHARVVSYRGPVPECFQCELPLLQNIPR